MKTRNLGNLAVSEIGMGCMGFSTDTAIPNEDAASKQSTKPWRRYIL